MVNSNLDFTEPNEYRMGSQGFAASLGSHSSVILPQICPFYNSRKYYLKYEWLRGPILFFPREVGIPVSKVNSQDSE